MKRKTGRRFFVWILAAALALGSSSFPALAEETVIVEAVDETAAENSATAAQELGVLPDGSAEETEELQAESDVEDNGTGDGDSAEAEDAEILPGKDEAGEAETVIIESTEIPENEAAPLRTAYAASDDESSWTTGTLSDDNTADEYTVALQGDGWLTANLKGGTIQAAAIKILNPDDSENPFAKGTIEKSSEEDQKTVQIKAALKAGIYTIRVNRYAAYSSGLQYTNGTYQMKYSIHYAQNDEEEPNDTFSDAMAVSPSQKVTGFLALNDTYDYYKFTIKKSEKVRITTWAMLYTWVMIYDENMMEVETVEGSYSFSASENNPEVLIYEDTLGAGTYYIRPSNGTNFNRDYGKYQFMYEFPDSQTKVTMEETELTTVYNKPVTINAQVTSNEFVPNAENLTWTIHAADGRMPESMGDVSVSGGNGAYKVSREITFGQLGKYSLTLSTDDGASADCEIKVVPSRVENVTLERTLNGGTMHAIKLQWDALEESSQLTGYQVWYSMDSGFTSEDSYEEMTPKNNETDTILMNLERNQEYHVRIRGYAEIDGETYEGEWTEEKLTTDKVILVSEAWGFFNYGTPTNEAKAKYYRPFIDGEARIRELLDSPDGDWTKGICDGMCMSAITLLWDENPAKNEVGLSDLYSVKNYADANYKTKEVIKYAIASIRSTNKHYEDYAFEDMPETLRTYLDNYLEGTQRPVLLALKNSIDGIGHAVLPICYYNTDDGLRVKVYDPNKPGDGNCWLEINESEYTWSYGDSYSGGYLLQKDPQGNWLSLGILPTDGFSGHGDEILMYIEGDYLNNVNTFRNENSLTSIERVFVMDAASDTDTFAGARGYWIDKLESYIFSGIPSGTEISLSASSHTVRLKADAECRAVLSVRDDAPCRATVTGAEGTAVAVEFTSYENDVQQRQNLSGVIASDGTLEFVAYNGGLQITGADSLSLAETKNQYDEEDNVTVLSDKTLEAADLDGTADYVISDHTILDSAEKILSKDTDGDGVGDEVVKDSLADTIKHGDDGNLCWTLDIKTGTLYLDGSGKTKDYTEETVPWAEYRDKITSVEISPGLTRLGDYLLSSLTGLASIEIPDSVAEIGGHAFSGDTSLKEVTIPANVTEIGANAFENCPKELVIVCDTDSAGETYAKENGYETKLIAAHEHAWNSGAITKEATCTAAGVRTYTCTRCGQTKTEALPAPGSHAWNSGTVVAAATCTTAGTMLYTCTRCGATRTEQIAVTGSHAWGNWNKTAKATVFAGEQQMRTCSRCGLTQQRTVGAAVEPYIVLNTDGISRTDAKYGQSFQIKALDLAEGDYVVSWKSSNTKIATVSSAGKVKVAKNKKLAGKSVRIRVTLASGKWKSVKVRVVKKKVSALVLETSITSRTIQAGKTAKITAQAFPITVTDKITYKSSNKKVATVNSKGVVKAKKKGTAKITVACGKKKKVIAVAVPAAKTTKISGVPASKLLKVKKSFTLKPKLTPSSGGEKVAYSSSNKSVAAVNSKGKVTAKESGKVVISVKSEKITAKCIVTVT